MAVSGPNCDDLLEGISFGIDVKGLNIGTDGVSVDGIALVNKEKCHDYGLITMGTIFEEVEVMKYMKFGENDYRKVPSTYYKIVNYASFGINKVADCWVVSQSGETVIYERRSGYTIPLGYKSIGMVIDLPGFPDK